MHDRKTKELFGFRGKTQQNLLLEKQLERAKHGDPFHQRLQVPPMLGAHFQYCMRRKGEKDAKFTLNQPTTTDTSAEIPQAPSRLKG